jgi:catechol 2,3-dioxygenase-like lactoylglutathione lyase family enzyme
VIHHVTIEASDLDRSGAFYDAVLGQLGWRRHADSGQGVGWGIAKPEFFVTPSEAPKAGTGHVCFTAMGIPAVKAAWEEGLENGGTDDGKPGPKPQYGTSYYSAYLLDPDGHRIEIAAGTRR